MTYKLFPPSEWIKEYNTKTLKSDFIAGITLAAYGIPVSLAYATLAGLPPQYGIYGYLIGGLFYALLGTSKQLAIGPTSAISLLIGTTIADMANGDVQRWADIASLTALVFAGMAILAYLLRLSGIINFISETVLVGFKAGAAITIGLTQLPKLFGIKGGGENFIDRIVTLFNQLPDTNTTVFVFGMAAIIILIVGEKIAPGRPVALIIVILSILLISTTSLGIQEFKTVGAIPTGLPEFHLPSLRIRDVDGVIPLALACFLLSYIESVSAGRTLAQKNGYVIDPRQELLALGIANAAVAFGQGYPVAGGLSQSAVNDTAGAKTPLSLVFASATIAICLLFLTGYLQNLPTVVLASIVLVAIRGLFDLKEMKHLYKINKQEFYVAIIALIGVLIWGILTGVLLAAIVTLLLLIKATSKPNVAFLGRIPGTKRYTDIERHPDNERIEGLLIVRIESAILYFNVEYIKEQLWKKINNESDPLKTVILDLNSSPRIDIAGARFLKHLFVDLKAKNISLKIAEARSEVRDSLRAEGLEMLLGHISRATSVDDLVVSAVKNK
ncbi:high affinity sulfate transporter 1 [Flavobacterium sp. 103]|uniref:SulP family inorganic anion transporter n=1 Tax=unclassified Flavobacterium TaxID=196869 RepID=UPI000D5F3068|nr:MULTISPECIES: SulP family inorganic anion transporter [unclassified Flavobacterium]PVX45797.1 high affinity sulfate transporter 1 [Flavobacterium sp. 103]QKJ62062.1 SulP family inorganic anion transporter [Flavobacterium sp. M31R6]